ncbi:hypothetical protein M9979_12315 [Sphingomonas sp. RP10(2022)]|uniref:Uncharacterized protein n=1 Tax=Sphingomonas liriopis TaxID=2949094 RepID=A0A9X2KU70_9SPHN|nr:hypothetical protein [Sphingomonas liriopis]MCP3735658.1 hypothetical protein [Sphingomonas liriopis]
MSPRDDAPLPIPTDMPTLEEPMDALRQFYMNGASDLMDKVLEQFILPDDRSKLALDFAQVVAFLMCIKVVDARGQKPTRENLLAVWWPFQKALKDDVPGMLRTFAEEAAGARA